MKKKYATNTNGTQWQFWLMPSKLEETYNEVKVFKSLMLYTLMFAEKNVH